MTSPYLQNWNIEHIKRKLNQRRLSQKRGDHDLNPHLSLRKNRQMTKAAVMIGLVKRPQGFTILFTQRSHKLKHHAGQISFPGGKSDHTDTSPIETALRETFEETGIPKDCITVIGTLDPYITRTGFYITPIVGVIDPPLRFHPAPYEVTEIFETPLHHFLTPGVQQRHIIYEKGERRSFHAMRYQDYFIWGATAGMMVNLIDVLTETG